MSHQLSHRDVDSPVDHADPASARAEDDIRLESLLDGTGLDDEPLPDGHVIVCGLRGVGLRIVEQLHLSGVPVVVVDDDPDQRLARIVQGWGVGHIQASAQLGDGLAEAGLATAAAVICVETSELATLEIAMRVHEARPGLRLVVQLANQSVGRALERVTGAGTVLDGATLAAPAFVEACLGRTSHQIDVGGVQFAIAQVTVDSPQDSRGTFRSHYGNLAPVAVVSAETEGVVCCPGRDHPLSNGDRVALLGTREDLEAAGIDTGRSSGPTNNVGVILMVRRRFVALMQSQARGLVLSLSVLAMMLVVATAIIRNAYTDPSSHHHLNVLTSLYFSVETVATVGFGDFSYGDQAAWLKVFAIVFILAGVTMVTTTFALFTNLLVSRRIEASLGKRPVPGLSGHVVVVGLGSVGVRVVEGLLALGRRVVVIERDESNRYLDRARALGVSVVLADATQRQTHAAVSLADVSAVAILTSGDLTNIETGLAMRESLGDRWEDVPVVLRVFDRNLARMMERNFGFIHVRSTSALAAPWFVGAALGLDIIGTFYVDQQPFLVGRLQIAAGGGLQGLAMQDLSASTRVIALRRNGGVLEHPPRRDTRFEGGDEAFLLGPYDELLRVLRRDQTATSDLPTG